MAYEQKDGDISLFKNKNSGTNNQPAMRGTMVWRGEKIKISVWKKGEGENAFLAGKCEVDNYVAPKSELPENDPVRSEPVQDDLPF